MYPISTESLQSNEKNLSANVIPSYMKGSNLHITEKANLTYDFVEISMPYLIMYQNINHKTNRAFYMEFSEQNRVVQNSPLQEYQQFTSKNLHTHNLYELTFVMSGSLTLQIEDDYVIYNAGDCCVCNKNIHHREVINDDAEFVLILMKEDFISNVLHTNCYYDTNGKEHSLGTFFYNLFANNVNNPFLDAKEYVDFRMGKDIPCDPCLEIMNHMIEEISGSHSGKSHMMKALLCRFIEHLENPSYYQLEQHVAKLSNEEQIIFDLTAIYTKVSHILSRDEIEKITGYHGDYVERIVKRNTGKTLSEFGRTFILHKAAMLFEQSELPIGTICENLGYSNRHYFNKIFNKEYGFTPSEYRKQKRIHLMK